MSVPQAPERKIAALDAVHRLIGSQALGESDRLRALLRYLVTEEIEGRGDRLKAFSIATDVFGRGSTFDPQTDSIVRVEVGRLRKALELYYATDGQADPLQISIARGGYRPNIALVSKQARGGNSRRIWLAVLAAAMALLVTGSIAWWLRPVQQHDALVIGVLKPKVSGEAPVADFIGAGVRDEFMALLSRSPTLAVVPLDGMPPLGAAAKGEPAIDFILRSSVQMIGNRLIVQEVLLSGVDGRVLTDRKDEVAFTVDDLVALQTQIAERIAQDVGRPFGLVGSAAMVRVGQTGGMDEISCYFRALRFFDGYLPADRQEAQSCFARLGKDGTLAPHSLAARALLELSAARVDGRGGAWEVAVARFSASAAKAFAGNAEHWLVRLAHARAALCRGDIASYRAESLADAERMGDNLALVSTVGTDLVLAADDAEQGLALVTRAAAANPAPEPWYALASAFVNLKAGQPDDAMRSLLAIDNKSMPDAALLMLLAAQGSGDTASMGKAKGILARNGLSDASALARFVERSCWSPATIDFLKQQISALPAQ
jgi:adenylate cyclase